MARNVFSGSLHKLRMELSSIGRGRGDPHVDGAVPVASLRRKFEGDPARSRHVLTETGVGYRLAP